MTIKQIIDREEVMKILSDKKSAWIDILVRINFLPSLPIEQGWINVNKIPKEGCYLAYADGIMYVCATSGEGSFWSSGELLKGITHYHHLPLPPTL